MDSAVTSFILVGSFLLLFCVVLFLLAVLTGQ